MTPSLEKKRSERPSPSQSAAATPVGTKMKGNDGFIYKVVKTSNGVKRWAKDINSSKRKTSKRKSVKRKSSKRKSVKRKSSKRKSIKRKTSKRKSVKRKSSKRKSVKRKSPKLKSCDVTKYRFYKEKAPSDRESLIKRLRTMVIFWEKFTTRNQDLGISRLKTETVAQIKKHFKWYTSTEAAKIWVDWTCK